MSHSHPANNRVPPPARWSAAIALLLATAIAGILRAEPAAAAERNAAAEAAHVERYLERLGLADLQVLHLENQLAVEAPASLQQQLAARLADLYAARLMDLAGERERYDDYLARIDRLTKRFPQANTPALQVMLLEADYSRAETLIARWLADANQTDARLQALAILTVIAPQLDQFQQQLNADSDKLLKRLDDLNANLPDDEQSALQQQLARQQSLAGRASYFAGWASYYRGLARPQRESPVGDFQSGKAAFQRLLEIGPQDKYADLDASWLGLESVWRARAAIGLGLTEVALGNAAGGRQCFDWLDGASVAPAIRDQAGYWYIQSLVNIGQLEEARRYATEQIENFTPAATQGKVSMCATLVRAGFTAQQSNDSTPPSDPAATPTDPTTPVNPPPTSTPKLGPDELAKAQAVAELGLLGLVRMHQYKAVGQLLAKYPLQAEEIASEEVRFIVRWLVGQERFADAEKSRQEDDYRAAVAQLKGALDSPQARQQLEPAGQCRYLLGWCYFRLGDYLRSGEAFQTAVAELKAAASSSAVESAWMAFAAYEKLAAEQASAANAAIAALETIKREFPDHTYARKADYYIARLRQAGASPEESIRALEAIPAQQPGYLAARYDLCRLRHRLWAEAETPAERTAAAVPVHAAVKSYLDAAGEQEEAARRLRCALLSIEVAAGTPEGAAQVDVDALLATADKLTLDIPPSSPLVAEYHYRAMVYARQTDGDVAAHADWLIRQAGGSVYELPALIAAARDVESRIDKAVPTSRGELREEAFELYRRLVEVLGDSPEALSARRNAAVANSKLAYYATQTGQHGIAAERLARLLAVYPRDKGYLRRAALTTFETGDYATSVQHWRTLLVGLSSDDDAWYEAKFYQIRCLQETDQNLADRVWQQFKLLHPDLGPPAWRDKFTTLGT